MVFVGYLVLSLSNPPPYSISVIGLIFLSTCLILHVSSLPTPTSGHFRESLTVDLAMSGAGFFASLPWMTRLKIALGAANGLAFLHEAEKPVIYRDFKASNILLDNVGIGIFIIIINIIIIIIIIISTSSSTSSPSSLWLPLSSSLSSSVSTSLPLLSSVSLSSSLSVSLLLSSSSTVLLLI